MPVLELHNMKKPTWIVFDVGDVLLEWQASSALLAEHLGVDKDALLDALFEYADDMFIGKISPIDGWTEILKKLDIKADPRNMILQWRDKRCWFTESLALVRDLHAAGYKLAVMSNSWLGLGDKRDANQLPDEVKLFSHIFDSSKAGVKKPDIRFYELVEQGIGADGQDVMLIDDSVANFVPARQKDWQCYHYITSEDKGRQSAKELRKALL